MSTATLEPKVGHEGGFYVRMAWGEAAELPQDTDGGMVADGYVAVSYLSSIVNSERDDLSAAEASMSKLITS
jgi:hypothetical protein